jgi:aryl sulfotransferase
VSGAVWLASYPRSGNTWTRLALRSLQAGGEDIALGDIANFGRMAARRALIDSALEIDSGLLTEAETRELRPDINAAIFSAPGEPQLCKVHDAWIVTQDGRPVFDAAFTAATIYLVRDPRDVAVSWAKFMRWPLDRAIAFMGDPDAGLGSSTDQIGIQVRQPMGTWSDHVLSWIDRSGLDPLVIRYEDMLADPAAALRAMAKRLGWETTEAAIAGAVAVTGFDRLADKEARTGFTERAPNTERFFASGKSGTWRAALTPEQAARIEREHEAVMARFAYH